MNIEKPKSVHQAQIILYGTAISALIRSTFETPKVAQMAASIGGAKFIILVQLVVFFSNILFTWLIGKRKNWARWSFIISFVLGTPFGMILLIQSFGPAPIYGTLGLAEGVGEAVAFVLLLGASSRQWFKKTS
jgi:hypothetical protein